MLVLTLQCHVMTYSNVTILDIIIKNFIVLTIITFEDLAKYKISNTVQKMIHL